MDDLLINFGSELKARKDGRVHGYLVLFGSADAPDFDGDFFTKETDFDIAEGQKTAVYFNHRLPLKTRRGGRVAVKEKIGEGTLSVDEKGVLIDAVLYNREMYEEMLDSCGWSSGTAPHLTEKEPAGKAFHVKRWPLGLDASITPTPANPHPENRTLTLKSYQALIEAEDEPETPPVAFKGTLAAKLNQHVDDLIDDGRTRDSIIHAMAAEAGLELGAVKSFLAGEGSRPSDANLKAFCRALRLDYQAISRIAAGDHRQSIKGMFEAALAESVPSRWELESVFSKVVSKLVAAASASNLAGVAFDLDAKIDEAAGEYVARLKELAKAQAREHLESGTDEHFYLKAIITPETAPSVSGGLGLDDHSLLAVSASEGLAARFRDNHEARVKSGRVLSEKNRTRLQAFRDKLSELGDECDTLLADSEPKATEAEKHAAASAVLRLRWRNRQLGVPANG